MNNKGVCDKVGKIDEILTSGNEVSFTIDLNKHSELSSLRYTRDNHSLVRGTLGALLRKGRSLLPQKFNSPVQVSRRSPRAPVCSPSSLHLCGP
jgi:hypothetical protein